MNSKNDLKITFNDLNNEVKFLSKTERFPNEIDLTSLNPKEIYNLYRDKKDEGLYVVLNSRFWSEYSSLSSKSKHYAKNFYEHYDENI